MSSSSVQYTALARLLTLNNRVHDLEELLRQMSVPLGQTGKDSWPQVFQEGLQFSPLADLQDEMDREVRASLVTCWLAMPESAEE
jgi:hypothetical protein